MRIYQLSPGAGPMFCGNCLRDNALVAALRQAGHEVLMLPLYLPLTLDEPDQSAGMPIFFGGINVYLEQRSPWYRRAPGWLHRLLDSPRLLSWAAGKAAGTRAADLGDLTLSMLRGEEGNQTRALDDLVAWLRREPPPDLIFLSNALLIGLARRLKTEFRVPIVCMLQGEDSFLDHLPETYRSACWQMLADRAGAVDLFVPATRYFGELMSRRLALPPERVRVVNNGINLEGYDLSVEPAVPWRARSPVDITSVGQAGRPAAECAPCVPAIGYLARMCPEKGLDTLVDAYLLLRRRGCLGGALLRVGGSCGPADEPFVQALRRKLDKAGMLGQVEFHPNLTRPGKIEFLRSLSVFSVPARYGEAFGLYVIEALAAGVPVVQPDTAAFPEVVSATGGGLLCRPGDPLALAEALETLLLDPALARRHGEAGREAVFRHFSATAMAASLVQAVSHLVPGNPPDVSTGRAAISSPRPSAVS